MARAKIDPDDYASAIAKRGLDPGACDGSLLDPTAGKEIGLAEVALSEAIDEFDASRRQAVLFLLREGGYTVSQISSEEAVA